MADAPDNAAYLLVQPNGALPNGRTLYADPFASNLQFSDSGPGANFELKPTLTLKSLAELPSAGLLAFDGGSTVNPRVLQSDTLNITSADGLSGNPQLEVLNDRTIQKVTIISDNGTVAGSRSQIKFINGNNISISPVEDPDTNSIGVTISANTGLPDDSSVALLSSNSGHSFNLGSLGSGLLKISVSGGVATPSIASSGTDYIVPSVGLDSLNMLTPSAGGLIYGASPTAWAQLPAGTDGYFLQSVSGTPAWVAPGAGTGTVTSVTVATSSGLLITGTNPITTSGTVNVDLPVGSQVGQALTITSLSPYTLGFGSTAPALATYLTQTGANLPVNGINLGASTAQLSIGTTSPSPGTTFQVNSTGTTSGFINNRFRCDNSAVNESGKFYIYGYSGTSDFNANVSVVGIRGSIASPAAILANDRIAQMSFSGFDGSAIAPQDSCSIIAQAAENYTTGAHGATLTFSTTPIGSITPIYPLRISDKGFVGVNNLAPIAMVDVYNDFPTSGTAIGMRLVQNIATGSAQLQMQTYFSASTTGGSSIILGASRGTNTASSAISGTGIILGRVATVGGNGTNTLSGVCSGVYFQSRGAFSGSASPTAILFKTTAVNTLNDAMIVDSTGNVGVGTTFTATPPAYRLDVLENAVATDNALSARFSVQTATATKTGVLIQSAKSSGASAAATLYLSGTRGTIASPGQNLLNDYIAAFSFGGQSSTQAVAPADLLIQATEDFVANTNTGVQWIFRSAKTGTSLVQQKMILDGRGFLGIGNFDSTYQHYVGALTALNETAINSAVASISGVSSNGNNVPGGAFLTNYGGTVPTAFLRLQGSRGTNMSAATPVSGNDIFATIDFMGNSATGANSFSTSANLSAVATTTWTNTNRPAVLVFKTTDINQTSSSQRMSLGGNGNLGVGLNLTGAYKLDVLGDGGYSINGTSTGATGAGGIRVLNYGGASTTPAGLVNLIGSQGTLASPIPIGANQQFGEIRFQGNAATAGSTNFITGARIVANVSASNAPPGGLWLPTNTPANLDFYITALGATNANINAMTMGTADNAISNVGINNVPVSGVALYVAGGLARYSPSGTPLASWNVPSDERLKTDIQDVTNALDIVNALRPRTFKYTSEFHDEAHAKTLNEAKRCDDDTIVYGFIAQELEQVLPSCVTDTNEVIGQHANIKSVNLNDAHIILFKAVQELSAKVDALKAENVVLKEEMLDLQSDNEHLMDRIVNLEAAGE